ncbi:MAG: SDR family NAD(P)-dependent oxidoreductase [Terrimicrobiaceae bacterium]
MQRRGLYANAWFPPGSLSREPPEVRRWLIEDRFGRLDVLVNNASIGEQENWESTAENAPIDTLRRTFDTNFFGFVDRTQQLLPLLRRSDNPRIVNQSSILCSLTEHSDPRSVMPMSRRSTATRARRP